MTILETQITTLLASHLEPLDVPTIRALVPMKGSLWARDRAVRNALQRLAARGDILRPARGVYQSK